MKHFKFFQIGKKWFALAAAALLLPSSMWAVRAYPGLMTMNQPDGTTLNVRLIGDENGHFYQTQDGILLLETENGFYYAVSDENGSFKPSAMRAANPSMRSAEAVNLIANLNQQQLKENYIKSVARDVKKSPARTVSPSVIPSNPLPGLFEETYPFPATGSPKVLIILAEYTDVKFSKSDEEIKEYFKTILSKENYTDNGFTGSAFDFYRDASAGQFTPQFDVYGPVTLPHNQKYYGGNDSYGDDLRPREMIVDACNALDSEIDFSQYDVNGSGYVDNVFVFYAGRGEASGGGTNTIWPHSWNVGSLSPTLDGVRIDRYACSNELTYVTDDNGNYSIGLDAIGTFCHEFGHVVGLPDIYATSYTSAYTPDLWDCMDSGSYNNNSKTPPTFSSFERGALGWLNPQVLASAGSFSFTGDLTTVNHAFLIPTSKATEFYLLEQRSQKGWDYYTPSNGMIVWHIDYNSTVWANNVVNNTASHQYVDLIEASGYQRESFRSWDAFPSEDYTAFTYETTPSLKEWSGNRVATELIEISQDMKTGNVSFVTSHDVTIVNQISVDGDIAINVNGKVVNVKSENTVAVDVYDVAGRKVASANSNNEIQLNNSGLYIVKAGNKSFKIQVR